MSGAIASLFGTHFSPFHLLSAEHGDDEHQKVPPSPVRDILVDGCPWSEHAASQPASRPEQLLVSTDSVTGELNGQISHHAVLTR